MQLISRVTIKRRKLTDQWYEFSIGQKSAGVRYMGRGSWHVYEGKRDVLRSLSGRRELYCPTYKSARAAATLILVVATHAKIPGERT